MVDLEYCRKTGHAPTWAGVGNFVHFINYAVRSGSKVLVNHLLTTTAQNDLLKCCYLIITEGILKEVKALTIFALILDEASDVSNKVQLSFGWRFVDSSNDLLITTMI